LEGKRLGKRPSGIQGMAGEDDFKGGSFLDATLSIS
jgi:hypothetical protein